jgi:SpoVK/Ycf46/Vps4 family AAA+-type ATPase
MELPIRQITTQKRWADIVLDPSTLQQLEDLRAQLQPTIEARSTKKRVKPGYRALFYGPPGTGKTLAATLLAKDLGEELHKIDLSGIVSKYIGETEKNLGLLFDNAEKNNWILFFDEADALFGKRTGVKDAHDKYANQEISYLLQRIEDYPGLLILASNMKNNLDDAFIRRFQSVIHFPLPATAERRKLWEMALSGYQPVEEPIDIDLVAGKFELSPASIVNIAEDLKQNTGVITLDLIDKRVQLAMSKQV